MADFSHSLTYQWNNGSQSLSGTSAKTGNSEQLVNLSVEAAVTDRAVNVDFAVSDLKILYILSTKAITIKATNNTAANPKDIVLVANVPYFFATGDSPSNPFATDSLGGAVTAITGLTVTIGAIGTTSADVKIRVMSNVA